MYVLAAIRPICLREVSMDKENMDKGSARLFTAWLVFAVLALVLAGGFAFLVAAARTPTVHEFFPNVDYMKVSLVAHVILAFIIWFFAFEGAFWVYIATWFLKRPVAAPLLAWGAFAFAAIGTALISVCAFFGLGEPSFVNYVPILDHKLFYAGFVILCLGILVAGIESYITIIRTRHDIARKDDLKLLRIGSASSIFAVFFAFLSFLVSAYFVLGEGGSRDLETVFWGGGHILQFTNTAAMVTVWFYITYKLTGKMPVVFNKGRFIFGLFTVFVMATPFAYIFTDIDSYGHRRFFTALMEFGLGPSTFVAAILVLRAFYNDTGRGLWANIRNMPWARPEFSATVFSMVLFLMGGLIAFTIYGYNTKIPAHYHGEIGGITLAFMGLAYYFFDKLKPGSVARRVASVQPYVYLAGQGLFVLAMFIAGAHGVARKTFGEAQGLDKAAKVISMALFGVGAFVAIVGGVLFIVIALRALLKKRQPENGFVAK